MFPCESVSIHSPPASWTTATATAVSRSLKLPVAFCLLNLLVGVGPLDSYVLNR